MKTRLFHISNLFAIASLATVTGIVASDHSTSPAGSQPGDTGKNIVDVAVGAGTFNTLAAALGSAELVETLKGKGPFTVLAPTDRAFAKLPKNLVDNLLKPENRETLQTILLYHVLPGQVPARDIVRLTEANTVSGQPVQLEFRDGALFVNKSRVIKTDVRASNGIIHVIDAVLVPDNVNLDFAGHITDPGEMIELALDRGVPHFNHGNVKACRDIYEVASHGLILMDSPKLGQKEKEMLRAAISRSRNESATVAAWTLRRALDRVHTRVHAMN